MMFSLNEAQEELGVFELFLRSLLKLKLSRMRIGTRCAVGAPHSEPPLIPFSKVHAWRRVARSFDTKGRI